MRNKKQFCVYKKRKEKRKDVCLPLERLFLRVLQTYTYRGNERVARRVDGADRGLRERASFDVSFCLLISGKSLGSREARRHFEVAQSPCVINTQSWRCVYPQGAFHGEIGGFELN